MEDNAKTAEWFVQVQCIQGPLQGKTFTYSEYQKVTVGRDKKATLCLDDKKLSKFHFILEILPSASVFLKDLGSTNGTFVGSGTSSSKVTLRKIDQTNIENGDYIKAGDVLLRISWPLKKVVQPHVCERCGVQVMLNKSEVEHDGKILCLKCQGKTEFVEGKRIGPFEVVRKLGEGNMGIVYLVKHSTHQHLFAIKILRPNLTPDKIQVDRFLREAACGMQAKHKNIVRHFQAGYSTEGGFFYIPMEYVQGFDCDTYMQKLKRPMTLAEANPLIWQLLDSVEYLHQCKIVHRDIKPRNILLAQEGNSFIVKLSDFGLAKNYEEAGLSGLTMTSHIVGTLNYLAPEQCINARDVDPKADIYSLGATLYFFWAAHPVFSNAGTTLHQMIQRILFEEPPSLTEANPQIPKPIARIVMQCLSKEPEDRYPNVTHLKKALEKVFPRQEIAK